MRKGPSGQERATGARIRRREGEKGFLKLEGEEKKIPFLQGEELHLRQR